MKIYDDAFVIHQNALSLAIKKRNILMQMHRKTVEIPFD